MLTADINVFFSPLYLDNYNNNSNMNTKNPFPFCRITMEAAIPAVILLGKGPFKAFRLRAYSPRTDF
jgi:hypothetical protein